VPSKCGVCYVCGSVSLLCMIVACCARRGPWRMADEIQHPLCSPFGSKWSQQRVHVTGARTATFLLWDRPRELDAKVDSGGLPKFHMCDGRAF